MTWLFQSVVCDMRKRSAPASRSSCKASPPVGVLPLVGGPGEKPMGKTLRPFRTRALSALTVTTEAVCAMALVAAKAMTKKRISRGAQRSARPTAAHPTDIRRAQVERPWLGLRFIMRKSIRATRNPQGKTGEAGCSNLLDAQRVRERFEVVSVGGQEFRNGRF